MMDLGSQSFLSFFLGYLMQQVEKVTLFLAIAKDGPFKCLTSWEIEDSPAFRAGVPSES